MEIKRMFVISAILASTLWAAKKPAVQFDLRGQIVFRPFRAYAFILLVPGGDTPGYTLSALRA